MLKLAYFSSFVLAQTNSGPNLALSIFLIFIYFLIISIPFIVLTSVICCAIRKKMEQDVIRAQIGQIGLSYQQQQVRNRTAQSLPLYEQPYFVQPQTDSKQQYPKSKS